MHAYAKADSGQPVWLDNDARSLAGKAVLRNLEKQKHSALAIAVGSNHAHLLVQLPVSRTTVKEAVGRAKLSASMKLKRVIPGRVWARGCNIKAINDEEHHRNTFAYIDRHRDEGAWVWTFRDGPIEDDIPF
ncbi:MAG: transposase [Phycisphaerales bacterium JB063]